MFLAFAIIGWSLILLGSLIQIFIAVVSLMDTTFELPSFFNDVNLFSKKTILNQSYLASNYGEDYMIYLIPGLLIAVATSVFSLSIYEIMRMKKGQSLAKPYVKIYFIVLIVASSVYGRVEALILASCLFVGLVLFETALFDTEGLKNYFEEREMIVIRREEKSFEKEVSNPGKHTRSVDKKQEMVDEEKINSKIIASSNENDNVETVTTFNYPKSILESSDKVNNYDLIQNETDVINNTNEYFAELGVSDGQKDPYGGLAADEEDNNNEHDTNMFGQSSLTVEKLNYNNAIADEDKNNIVEQAALFEESKFTEDKVIELPQKTIAISNEQNNFVALESNDLFDEESIDFEFRQIDNASLITNTFENTDIENEQVDLAENTSSNENLTGKKAYKKWTNLQTIIMLKLDMINDLYAQADEKSQAKVLKKAQKDYNKKVKKANLLADKLNLDQQDYFKYIEITSAKSENQEKSVDDEQIIDQFDIWETQQQIGQTLDSEEEFNFDLLEAKQSINTDNVFNTIAEEIQDEIKIKDTSFEETNINLNLNDMQENEINTVALEDTEDESTLSEANIVSEEDHFIEQNFDEQEEDIIPSIKVESASVFKFNEQTVDEKIMSNNDIFNDIEKNDEQTEFLEDQQISNQQQLIKDALNDEKWEQRFDLFDNRLTKLEKIMIDSSFWKIEKDKNFEKLHLDLNQIQTNLKKISGDVVGLEEKTQQISKAINNERSSSNIVKHSHNIDQHYPKVDDFNFNLSKYSLYNRSGYSNTYGTVTAQDLPNKYNGPRKISDYNKIKSKAYSGDYLNNENIEKLDYGHVSLHNISKYTKETVPFEDNCALCKKIKA